MKKKELEKILDELYEILKWRHCQDNWHLDYHKVIEEANSILSKYKKNKVTAS